MLISYVINHAICKRSGNRTLVGHWLQQSKDRLDTRTKPCGTPTRPCSIDDNCPFSVTQETQYISWYVIILNCLHVNLPQWCDAAHDRGSCALHIVQVLKWHVGYAHEVDGPVIISTHNWNVVICKVFFLFIILKSLK